MLDIRERENRVSPRYHAVCRAHIDSTMKCDAVLKNLSITGCCLECNVNSETLKTSQVYKIDIEPERDAHISDFELEAECKWIRKKNEICEVGFQIVTFPKGKSFQNYVDYLAYFSNSD
jgi:hypothetical protein